ncbi:glycosyltransferase family 4 protein [Rubritalea profundi]|uniref:Glycosyl transferase family 1 domain-containing protein n=1 Tax=Rubritalea profundi TaxID=1658618 RepID=A0A2S7U0P4_9BACT|nr:glycosyltransferase family 4 protein [Rubritalea profundi]PQJ28077.1 hypothetical protein BSZ32_05875 [Rubritalea profundi]
MTKLLQILNRYLEYGGEEGCAYRMGDVFRNKIELFSYIGSTAEELERPLGKLKMPFLMQKNARAISEIRRLQKEHQFDVWQIDNVFPSLSVAIYELADELSIPVIQYLHNYRFGCVDATYFRAGGECHLCSPGHYFPGLKHKCWRGSSIASLSMGLALNRFWSKGERAISVYIALSEAQKKRHVEMGISADRICVLPHFLEVDEQALASEPARDGDVLYLGRLTDEKGVMLLLKSWQKVKSKGRMLRIAGTGPLEDELRNYVHVNNLKNVEFLGFVPKEKHHELWSRASFFVAPSIWEEPFGMVILESWLNKRPVLASNLGNFPELIEHGVDGWLADVNPESFSKELQKALDDTESYSSMGLTGYEKLMNEYNKDVWFAKWRRIADSVLEVH